MSYTAEMRESIKSVEASRSQRMQETHRRLTLEEQQELLRHFHPDYVMEGMRELRVGPNAGDRTPNEFADLLEARSRVDPRTFDLSRVDYETDVLIIGGGGAGASAALLALEQSVGVLVATKLRFGDANTMMSQGGIQAADRPEDSPAIHYLDVIGGGHFANIPELVEALVLDAPFVIQWLESLGCMFDKQPDGAMVEAHGGGTSRKRMHSARDYSGAEIMRTLRDEVRSRPDIQVLEFAPAIDLVLDDKGQAAGAILMNLETGDYLLVKAKTVIMATGGSGRLHYQGFPTTNHHGATGDGVDRVLVTAPPTAIPEALRVCRFGGIVALIGLEERAGETVVLDINAFHFQKLQLRASHAIPNHYFPIALDLLARRVINTDRLITHTFHLNDFQRAFETATEPDERVGKVIIEP